MRSWESLTPPLTLTSLTSYLSEGAIAALLGVTPLWYSSLLQRPRNYWGDPVLSGRLGSSPGHPDHLSFSKGWVVWVILSW